MKGYKRMALILAVTLAGLSWLAATLFLPTLLWAGPQAGSSTTSSAAPAASAGVPRLIRFSGVVQDATGKPVSGDVGLTFSLYELPSGGTPLWVDTQSVQADSQGAYTALLGANSPEGLPLDLFTSGQALWLGVQAALPGVGEQPRVLLVAVPYALKAADADTLGGKPASAYITAESQSGAAAPSPSQAATASPGRSKSKSSDSQGAANTSTSNVTGTGTTNFIPIWTTSTNLGNSTLFQTGGQIGVGTTTPGATLDVKGSVRGSISGATGTAVTGDANGTTGVTNGVAGVTKSSTAHASGVFGQASATAGVIYGVNGSTSSTTANAAAVNGFEGATTGHVFGVNGNTSSTTTNAAGVNGFEGATTGQVYGVAGSTNSTTSFAAGVSGFDGATTGQVFGVTGSTNSTTTNAAGVNAFEGATTGQVYGVLAGTASTTASAAGVNGFAAATSGQTIGVSGTTNSSTNGAIGVFGQATAATGAVDGVSGSTNSTGNGAAGVNGFAAATSGQTNGVSGATNSSTAGANGVVGVANATTGVTFGVQGVSSSSGGVGVQGSSPNVAVAGFNQVCNPSCTLVTGTAGKFVTATGGTILQGLAGSSFTQVFSVDASGNGFYAGNLNVTGKLTKGSGSFKIDHPLDPANKYLSHSFVESPDMMDVYNGVARVDAKGQAWVNLPDYFEALNRDFRYQLTSIGSPAPNLYVAREVIANRFKIAGGKPGGKVSWQVTGIRQDPYANANRIPVTEDKPPAEQGHYLHPEVYGERRPEATSGPTGK